MEKVGGGGGPGGSRSSQGTFLETWLTWRGQNENLLQAPCLFRLHPECELTKLGSCMQVAAESFGAKFSHDPSRQDTGRSQRKCSTEVNEAANKLVGEVRDPR